MGKRQTVKPSSLPTIYARVVNEPIGRTSNLEATNSDPAHRCALRRKSRRTFAERQFEQLVLGIGNGFLIGKFETEWAICGRWILDFYFPEYRLAVEIDGRYHDEPNQKERDLAKAADCEKLEITLLRLTNDEVIERPVETELKLLSYFEIAAARAADCTKIVQRSTVRLMKCEMGLIKRYIKFYRSLATGARQPATVEQEHFVAVLKGEALPETKHEIAFAKFILIQSARLDKDTR